MLKGHKYPNDMLMPSKEREYFAIENAPSKWIKISLKFSEMETKFYKINKVKTGPKTQIMDRTRKDQTTYMSSFHKRSGCYLGIKMLL